MNSKNVLVILLASILFFGCKDGTDSKENASRIVVRGSSSPNGLNPTSNLSAVSNEIYTLLFQPMADYNPETLEFEPILLDKLPVETEITEGVHSGSISYSMQIKDEAKWHDGKDITGKDYEFSVKSIIHPKTSAIRYRAYLDNIVDVIVDPDDIKTVEVILKNKSIASMELVTTIPMMPRHIYDSTNALESISIAELRDSSAYGKATNMKDLDAFADEFNSVEYSRNTVVGSGRYKLKEWLSDQFISLERVENHWMKGSSSALAAAKPKEIVFLLTPDETTAYTQLKSGAIDIFGNLSYQQITDLKNSEVYANKFTFHEVKIPKYYFININTRRSKLSDKTVRKALAYLIDVDTIINSYENGLGERVNSPFLSVDKKSTLPDVKFDRVKAEELLATAGWTDTNNNGILDKIVDGNLTELELDFIGTGSALGKVISGVYQQMAKKSGVKINVINLDNTQFKKRIYSTDFDLAVAGKGQSLAPYDPYSMLHTDNVDPGEGNISNFGNAESDALIEIIRNTTDPEIRDKAYLDLEKVMNDEQAMIFLYSPVALIAHKKEINGVVSIKNPGYAVQTFH